MKSAFGMVCCLALTLAFAFPAWSQSNTNQDSTGVKKTVREEKKTRGPGKEAGKGGEDIGKGVGKGAGDLGKGVAGGVGNLATGNVGGAGADLGKGAGGLGKNVTEGTAKGVGKIGKGTAGGFKRLFHRSKKKQTTMTRVSHITRSA